MSAQQSTGQPLLLVIAPEARRVDGESVRIAKDVLCAGAPAKVTFPESLEDLDRALAHRGRRQPVVIGDDAALRRVLEVLHRQRELAAVPVSLVPVGPRGALSTARALGIPTEAVAAARAVLDGVGRWLDLLVDDSGGVVLGTLHIPGLPKAASPHLRRGDSDGSRGGAGPAHPPANGSALDASGWPPTSSGGAAAGEGAPDDVAGGDEPPAGDPGREGWCGRCGRAVRSAARALAAPLQGPLPLRGGHRLRVEVDGVLLTDLDQPVHHVAVSNARMPSDGLCPSAYTDRGLPLPRWVGVLAQGCAPDDGVVEVILRRHAQSLPTRVRAKAITVSGRNFHYRVDSDIAGPVRTRTWTVLPRAWRLTVPRSVY